MSIRGDIYLGASGSEILVNPFGRSFQKYPKETTREERTVNGTLKKDIMYIKHTFTLSYSSITGDALAELQTIYDLAQELNLIYWENGSQYTHAVYMKPMKRKRELLLSDGLYKGVTVQLSEA